MKNGISGAPIPQHLPYAPQIQAACVAEDVSPCLVYGIGWRETISGQGSQWPSACSVVSFDHGYGLFQITSPFCQPWPPNDWADPVRNTKYAIEHYIKKSWAYFVECGVSGDVLVQCIAAGFNAGAERAWLDHQLGDVDRSTTGHNYASSVLANYHRMIAGKDPQ